MCADVNLNGIQEGICMKGDKEANTFDNNEGVPYICD